MKKFLTIPVSLLFVLSSFFVMAERIDMNTARNLATNFYYEKALSSGEMIKAPESLVLTYTEFKDNVEMYYVFSAKNGYVIIAADNDVYPVLAYSFEGKYSKENVSPDFAAWMGDYDKQISYVKQNALKADCKISETWNKYLADDFVPQNTKSGSKSITPLLMSIWDQGRFYNYLCPEDTGGQDGHVWTGCVATAMAQVMYYYRYPAQGTGSHGYNSDYGYLSANFGTTTYNWYGMQNDISGKYNFDMAQLQSHLGISIDMMYSPSGSGAYMDDDANAMKNNFGYSSTTQLYNRNSYNDNAWANLIKANLDNKMPVQYAGYGSEGGHAFVCDGYQGTDYFHFNWGWSGTYNGYFYLNNLNPGYTFNSGHQAILNSYPATNYPQNCSGLTTITNTYGTIEDGSGPKYNYQDNKDCMWLIAPTEIIDNIRINFERIDTEIGNDVVTIYDGESTSDSVLGVFSGNSLPAQIVSTGKKVLVRFTTNGSVNAEGWLLTFNGKLTSFCSNLTELNTPNGTISDGSDVNNYNNNSNCKWRINLPEVSNVNISFNSFDLASDNDFIKIYDEAANTLITTLTNASHQQSISLVTNKVLILFLTNSLNTAQGWDLNYSSTPLAVKENEGNYLLIGPNPATNYLNIETNLQGNQQVSIDILNSMGQTVMSKKVNGEGAKLNEQLDISHLAQGIYFLRLTGENLRRIQKFTIQ
ncbi:MAG: C10 family peptidase [Bacteroidota bacterium]